jgi:2-phosphoglycerate kinase
MIYLSCKQGGDESPVLFRPDSGLRREKVSFLIAIGGARGSGKSTLARLLGTTLRADVIHLGRIRSVLRSVPGHDPVLDISVNKEAQLV